MKIRNKHQRIVDLVPIEDRVELTTYAGSPSVLQGKCFLMSNCIQAMIVYTGTLIWESKYKNVIHDNSIRGVSEHFQQKTIMNFNLLHFYSSSNMWRTKMCTKFEP